MCQFTPSISTVWRKFSVFARGLLLIAPLVVLPGFHMNKKKLIDAVENMSIQAHHSQEEQFSLLLS
jgi:hypothetical protein